jgi:tetratricopeptide (TPR) repeat protein
LLCPAQSAKVTLPTMPSPTTPVLELETPLQESLTNDSECPNSVSKKLPWEKTLVHAEALRYLGRYTEAKALYEDLLEDEQAQQSVWVWQGSLACLFEGNHIDVALIRLNEGLKRFRFDPGLWRLGAQYYQQYGMLACAQQAWQHLLRLRPSDTDARFSLALLQEDRGDGAGACESYQAILTTEPQDIPTLNNLASLYLNQRRWEEALPFFNQLLAINPTFYRGLLGKAVCFEGLGLPELALPLYETLVRLKQPVASVPEQTLALAKQRIFRLRNRQNQRTLNVKRSGRFSVSKQSSVLRLV